jgi:hypothetical protein
MSLVLAQGTVSMLYSCLHSTQFSTPFTLLAVPVDNEDFYAASTLLSLQKWPCRSTCLPDQRPACKGPLGPECGTSS